MAKLVLMEGFRIDLKTFWAWLCLTNAPELSESKYQAGFGVIILGQNPLTFIISIYSTTVLYDTQLMTTAVTTLEETLS